MGAIQRVDIGTLLPLCTISIVRKYRPLMYPLVEVLQVVRPGAPDPRANNAVAAASGLALDVKFLTDNKVRNFPNKSAAEGLENMDKAGIDVSMCSIIGPGIWFGDIAATAGWRVNATSMPPGWSPTIRADSVSSLLCRFPISTAA